MAKLMLFGRFPFDDIFLILGTLTVDSIICLRNVVMLFDGIKTSFSLVIRSACRLREYISHWSFP